MPHRPRPPDSCRKLACLSRACTLPQAAPALPAPVSCVPWARNTLTHVGPGWPGAVPAAPRPEMQARCHATAAPPPASTPPSCAFVLQAAAVSSDRGQLLPSCSARAAAVMPIAGGWARSKGQRMHLRMHDVRRCRRRCCCCACSPTASVAGQHARNRGHGQPVWNLRCSTTCMQLVGSSSEQHSGSCEQSHPQGKPQEAVGRATAVQAEARAACPHTSQRERNH